MTLSSLLAHWKASPEIANNIVEWRILPARSAQVIEVPKELSPELVEALYDLGIRTLYSHQIDAWEQTNQRENIVVQTGTASGKTLCYNLPVLDLLLKDDDATALYLFPTKALAQDQLAKIHNILDRAVGDGRLNTIQDRKSVV